MKYIGGFVTYVALLVAAVAFRGFVLTKLWYWFAVPVFKLPELAIPAALGIALIVSLLTHENNASTDKKDSFMESAARGFVLSFGLSAFSLLSGWLIHFFM